jgi:hypothetical protein
MYRGTLLQHGCHTNWYFLKLPPRQNKKLHTAKVLVRSQNIQMVVIGRIWLWWIWSAPGLASLPGHQEIHRGQQLWRAGHSVLARANWTAGIMSKFNKFNMVRVNNSTCELSQCYEVEAEAPSFCYWESESEIYCWIYWFYNITV